MLIFKLNSNGCSMVFSSQHLNAFGHFGKATAFSAGIPQAASRVKLSEICLSAQG
jgi:hypothetical protein